jgi:hypothetical protein
MNPGMSKRQREMARRQKQQEKSARKQQRQQDKKDRLATLPAGEDPDLVGIVPGPQPRSDEDLAGFDAETDEEAEEDEK